MSGPGTASNVTTGKRGVDGGVYLAPAGTTLPTTATETLNAAFKNLGYVSEDGMTNSLNRTSEDIKEWGGNTVDSVVTDQAVTWQAAFIEALNVDLLKAIYGNENVIESGGAITVKVKAIDPPACVIVIDMALKGRLKRTVIPNAKITELGDIVYRANEAVAYDVTIKANLDNAGYSQYEYISAAGTT